MEGSGAGAGPAKDAPEAIAASNANVVETKETERFVRSLTPTRCNVFRRDIVVNTPDDQSAGSARCCAAERNDGLCAALRNLINSARRQLYDIGRKWPLRPSWR
jgi:hypothetical protein